MFQKKCIVCNQYISVDDFGDEFEEKTGYGLICRDCLIDRQFFDHKIHFTEPQTLAEVEHLDSQGNEKDVLIGDKKILSDLVKNFDFQNLGENNKIRIASLDVNSNIKNRFYEKKIRTLGGVRFEERGKRILPKIDLLTLKESEEFILSLAKYLEKNPTPQTPMSLKGSSIYKLSAYFDNLVCWVSLAYNVSVEIVLSKNRDREAVKARFVIIYILREYFNGSYLGIAKLFNKDHTTIMHADRSFRYGEHFNPISEYEVINSIVNNVRFNQKKQNTYEKSEIVSVKNEENKKKLRDKNRKSFEISTLARKKISERNFKIFQAYKKGETLQEIGGKYFITRERVRQIIVSVISVFAARESMLRGRKAPSIEKAVEIEKALHNAANRLPAKIKNNKKSKAFRWSRDYDHCILCGTTKVKHFKKGLCEVCGGKSIYGEQREQIIGAHDGKCDSCGISREKAKEKFGSDFYLSRKEDSVFCKSCFRQLTGNILANKAKKKKRRR